MVTKFNSNYDETYPFSDTTARFGLTIGVEQTYTVPGTNIDRYQAIFSYNSTANIFIGLNTTVTVPAANTVETTQVISYRPERRYVKGGDVIHAVTPDATAYFGVELRILPSPKN